MYVKNNYSTGVYNTSPYLYPVPTPFLFSARVEWKFLKTQQALAKWRHRLFLGRKRGKGVEAGLRDKQQPSQLFSFLNLIFYEIYVPFFISLTVLSLLSP